MNEPEILLPPTDPGEEVWRKMMRDHATRMRIMREEMEKQNPLPFSPMNNPGRLMSIAFCLGAVFTLACAGLGLLFAIDAKIPPRAPLHVIIDKGAAP